MNTQTINPIARFGLQRPLRRYNAVSRRVFWAELFGTYCLVFAGTGAAVVDGLSGGRLTGLGVGMVFGLAAFSLAYAIGHISGAHLNPAVTVGLWLSKRHKAEAVIPYIAAQLIGALLASLTLKAAFASVPTTLGQTMPAFGAGPALLMELVLTFIFVMTVIGAATDQLTQKPLAALAIGAALGLGVIVGGPVSGGSLNPARSFGPALATGQFAHQWVYWLGPLAGACLAAWLYRALARPEPLEPGMKVQPSIPPEYHH